MDKAALTGLLALGLLLTPGVARADITETGTNSPVPIVSGAPYVLVGNGAPNQGILSAGAFGTGTIIISGGAQVTDTRAPADYGVNGAVVASAAGSTGTLTLTGAGTTATFHNFFIVGSGVVAGTPGNPTGFGTPGATTVGTLNVTAGATLNTNGVTFGQPVIPGPNNAQTGTEHTFGIGTINGAGSTMTVTSITGTGGIGLGGGTNATGNVTVSNGGTLNLTTSSPTLRTAITLGGGNTAGGSGSLTVDAGTVNFIGPFSGGNAIPVIVAGSNQGSGTVLVQNGGSINGVNSLTVGQNGSTGTTTITGTGSTVSVAAAGTSAAFVGVGIVGASPPAGVTTATGTLNVQNGGQLDISLNSVAGAVLNIGQRGGTGTVNVSGAGSQIVMSGTNNGDAVNTSGVQIGRSGSGDLNVTNGGAVIINDTPGYGYVLIGGANGQVNNNEPAGTGTVLVSGAGSIINVQSAHGSVTVGRDGTGTLIIQNGGAVNAETVGVGRDAYNPAKPLAQPGAIGNLTVSGAGSQLNISGDDGPSGTNVNGGARLAVGLAGTGMLTVSGGGAVNINPDNPANAKGGGLFIGGSVSGVAGGGTGTVNVVSGSSITIGGSATNSVIVVGGNGTGTLNLDGASTVSLPSTGAMYVGAPVPGTTPVGATIGSVTVANGSTLNAGSFLGIATNIVIGASGVFGGNGTVIGAVTNNGGVLQVGASPDALLINGAYTQHGGTINLEIFSNGSGGYLTDSLIFTNPAQVTLDNVTFAFNFMSSNINPLDFFATYGQFNLSTFLLTGDGTNNTPQSPTQLDAIVTAPNFQVVTTPEPGTLPVTRFLTIQANGAILSP